MSDLSENVPDPTDLPIFSSARPGPRRSPGAHALAGQINPFVVEPAPTGEHQHSAPHAGTDGDFGDPSGGGPALYLGLQPVARRRVGSDPGPVPVPPASSNPAAVSRPPADLSR